jgi:alpha-ketoglutarate-dependent taurine dioxygenase
MNTITPTYRPNVFPERVSHYAVGDLTHLEITQVTARLADDGLMLFEGLDTPAALLAAATHVMRLVAHPDSGPDTVTAISDRGPVGDRPGQAGFSHRALAAHTDRSGATDPPGLIMVSCGQPGTSGGESLLADGAEIYIDLVENAPATLEALASPQSVLFGGAVGHLGPVFDTDPDQSGRYRLRLRLDDLAAWSPEVTRAHLRILQDTITRHTFTVPLVPGRGYLADNHRWLHARTGFTGPRLVYRVLGIPHPTLNLTTGIPVR